MFRTAEGSNSNYTWDGLEGEKELLSKHFIVPITTIIKIVFYFQNLKYAVCFSMLVFKDRNNLYILNH